MPGTLTIIGALAFRGNNLESVIIPDGVRTIGNISFMNNQITEISFPDSVTSVGDGAFQSNPITRVTIGDAVAIGTVYSMGQYGSAFKSTYYGNGKLAGTYVYEGGQWVKE